MDNEEQLPLLKDAHGRLLFTISVNTRLDPILDRIANSLEQICSLRWAPTRRARHPGALIVR